MGTHASGVSRIRGETSSGIRDSSSWRMRGSTSTCTRSPSAGTIFRRAWLLSCVKSRRSCRHGTRWAPWLWLVDIQKFDGEARVMDILEAIAARRSVRKFIDRPVTEETVNAVLAAAVLAPSGKNHQSWRFVVVAGAEKRAQMIRVMREGIADTKARGIDTGSAIMTAVSYTHLRAHETRHDLVCRLLLEKKKKK